MKCKNCNQKDAIKYSKYTSGEYCSKECSRAYSTKSKRSEINRKVSETLSGNGHGALKKECSTCRCKFEVEWRKREQKFCSTICQIKGRKSRINLVVKILKKCPCCEVDFEVENKKDRTFCSRSCSVKFRYRDSEFKEKLREYGRKGGLNSVQGKRSKNEIYFAALCEEKFDKVLMNEPIFNGWDADVIVEDFKIAVLWNGKWHYEKITESHSLNQVQNRDKIKIKEITNSGYKPYVIKDMGKEDSEFVKKEFEKFLKYIAGWTGGGSSSVS